MGVLLFVLSSAVLPNVFAFSVPVFVLSVPVFVFSSFFLCFPLPCSSALKDPGMFLRFRQISLKARSPMLHSYLYNLQCLSCLQLQ